MEYKPGERVGDYEVVEVLGAGGMGRVYKVRNLISDRFEAMKVLLPDLASDPGLAHRFTREIKVQASLEHPNIASLHTAQTANNQLLMFLEYVEGSTVETELRRGPMPVAKAVDYIRQVLFALAYAHGNGVVHRDVKPANIMATPEGVVKLMDFGIARLAVDRKLTQTGQTVGSLPYMSPEQIQGAAELDGRSDLYSLGVTLYEMVTGRRPFDGESDYSIMTAHLRGEPMRPSEVDPSLSPVLSDIILMAIARDPARRFQTADAFRTALASLAATVTVAAQTVPPPQPPNRRALYVAAGSLATALVVGIALYEAPNFFPSSAAPSAPATAQSPERPQPLPLPELRRPDAVPKQPAATAQRQIPAEPAVRPASATLPSEATSVASPVAESALSVAPAEQVDNDLLADVRDAAALVEVRASAAKPSLKSLREQQARMGLNLRQDILAAEQRLDYHLDETASALKAGDPARAKKNLDLAERALEVIERFLGR